MAYDDAMAERALKRYEYYGRVLTKVADEDDMPSAPTLRKMKEEGRPTALTGGRDWDVYLEEKREQMLAERRVEIAERAEVNADDLISSSQRQMSEMLEVIHDKFLRGEVDVRGTDYVKLLEKSLMLENMDADKLQFMRWFVEEVFSVVVDEFRDSPGKVQRVKSAISGLLREEMSKLNLPRNASKPTDV